MLIVTEAKLHEVAKSNVYHDDAFVKFLKVSKSNVNGDTLEYVKSLREQNSYLTIIVKVKQVYSKEIIIVTKKNQLWHLSYETLKKLNFTKIDMFLQLIERKGANNKCLFEELRKVQPSKLLEVSTYPRPIHFQLSPKVDDVSHLAIPGELNQNNGSKINQVINQLKLKKGFMLAEELEAIHILHLLVTLSRKLY